MITIDTDYNPGRWVSRATLHSFTAFGCPSSSSRCMTRILFTEPSLYTHGVILHRIHIVVSRAAITQPRPRRRCRRRRRCLPPPQPLSATTTAAAASSPRNDKRSTISSRPKAVAVEIKTDADHRPADKCYYNNNSRITPSCRTNLNSTVSRARTPYT